MYRSGDILTELRFFVPNIEQKIVDDYDKEVENRRKERKEAKQAGKNAEMKSGDKEEEDKENESEEESSDDYEDDAPTPANVFNEKLLK